jgi:hypothetical protein
MPGGQAIAVIHGSVHMPVKPTRSPSSDDQQHAQALAGDKAGMAALSFKA